MTVSRVELGVVISDMAMDLIVNGGIGFEPGLLWRTGQLFLVAVWAMATAGMAAISALEVVGSGEHEVRAVHVEVFRGELLRGGLGCGGRDWGGVGWAGLPA